MEAATGGGGITTTRVYSIRQAVTELSQRRQQAQRRPVDLLGIVTATLVQPTGSYRYGNDNSNKKQCLHIMDQEGSSAFITLLLHHTPTREESSFAFRVGDVCRFNRVSLKRSIRQRHITPTTASEQRDSAQKEEEKQDYDNHTTHIPHFWHSWDDPEPGMEWCRLGHFDNDTTATTPTRILKNRPLHIPTSMQTAPDQIHHLIAAYCANNKQNTTSQPKVKRPLSQLPCRPRLLEDMISCVGSVGDVIVKVEQIVEQPSIMSSRKGRTYRSFSKYTPKQQRASQVSTVLTSYAILSEGRTTTTTSGGDILGRRRSRTPSSSSFVTAVIPEPHRFLTTLRKAQTLKCRVRLCGVRSQRMTNSSNVEDTVLCLSPTSRVTLLSTSHDDEYREIHNDSQKEKGRIPNTQLSWLTADGEDTQTSVGSTMTFSAHIKSIRLAAGSGGGVTISTTSHKHKSCTDDIVDLVLVSRRSSNGHDKSQTQGNPPEHEDSLVLFLVELSGMEIGQQPLTVYADQDIVWQLCGGCSRSGKDRDQTLSKETARSFLKGLLQAETQLQWVTTRTATTTSSACMDAQWQVMAVSLQVLH